MGQPVNGSGVPGDKPFRTPAGGDETASFPRPAGDGNPSSDTREAAGAPLPPPPELADHPRYRILEFLGAGGMGVVYKARHRLMDRDVALKVINRHLFDRREMVERFAREMRAAARLSHPNIVTAYDADQVGDTHFLVMELIDGTNLDEVLAARGRLPVRVACDYARQAALGLQHAFQRGMVHRDIKPHNLMLTRDGVVKILDFGLARCVSEAVLVPSSSRASRPQADDPDGGITVISVSRKARQGGLTGSYTALGTVDYLAPEEVVDARRADIRADVYSLGCTLYRCLTGQVPFPDGTLLDKMKSHLERTPTAVAELRPEVPGELARVVERMMAKDPAGRYSTPAEAAQALASFAARTSRRVLVVDDEWLTREAMRRALEAEGYEVRCAADGREALTRLRAEPPPDLILLDLMMPVMTGWEFLEERKQTPALASIPVVVVSATDPEQSRAIALGAADSLQKPVPLDQLADRIKHINE